MKNKSLYQNKKEFYTDPVIGSFYKIRTVTMSCIVFLYFFLPWINWNNHQAFLFDVSYNRFYVFGSIIWPHDFVLVALFVIFCIIFLFAVTLYSGRIWCGFFCPQSIWIRMSMFFVRLFEGKRNKRYKLDSSSMSVNKFFIKFFKHISLLILSFLTAFTFIGYFIPIRNLYFFFISLNIFNSIFFWIVFFTFLTYFNISWFKEQFCFLVCPYARLQSVMFDENTLIVSYDKNRGEKRGSRSKNINYKEIGLGDCIDCMKCVTCCPTGIDIRNGLQIECISCGACVDACNDVMRKMGYKENLISFKKDNFISKSSYINSRVKLMCYSIVLLILIILFSFFLITRSLSYISVNRPQYQLFNVTNDNFIENSFFIKIINKSDKLTRYKLYIDPEIFFYDHIDDIFLESGKIIIINIKLKAKNDISSNKFIDVFFKIECLNDKREIFIKKNKFVFP